MDTTPIYELRERLRAAAMAGTSLLSEDFRLKRALEAFRPMEAASPVFAKVGQLTERLMAPDCLNPQGALLDAITLADAVICTLGTVDVPGEMDGTRAVDTEADAGSLIVNAPYSVLKELLEALTTSGSGHYGTVCDIRENRLELFQDYRVKYALVQALGASYAELADKVEHWLKEDNDRTILPFLYQNFDPKGNKEMVRRVKVIDALAGAKANDFYIKMLEKAQKEVRQALIFALRHRQENVPLLLDMAKTERGKNRDAVFMALANIEDERASTFLREFAGKEPEAALKYLIDATSAWSGELVAEICDRILEQFDQAGDLSTLDKEQLNKICLPYDLVLAMFGKSGTGIRKCYQKLIKRKDRINCYLERWRKQNPYAWQCDIVENALWYRRGAEMVSIERGLDKILQQSLVVNPDPDLRALAMELYQKDSDNHFLSSVVTVKFLEDEDCAEWLEQQIATAKYPAKCMDCIVEAAAYIQWNERQNGYQMHGRAITLSHAKKLMEWFQRHASEEVDELLMLWLPLNDREMCQKMGEYYYNRASQFFGENRAYMTYLRYLEQCGWTDCKGLGVKYIKNHRKDIGYWSTFDFLRSLPGGSTAIREEFRTICSLIDSGKIQVDAKAYEVLKQRMENWLITMS